MLWEKHIIKLAGARGTGFIFWPTMPSYQYMFGLDSKNSTNLFPSFECIVNDLTKFVFFFLSFKSKKKEVKKKRETFHCLRKFMRGTDQPPICIYTLYGVLHSNWLVEVVSFFLDPVDNHKMAYGPTPDIDKTITDEWNDCVYSRAQQNKRTKC